jgi:predicted ATPase
VQTTLGPALIATKGQAAPEVLHAYTRARELCQQVGETPQLFQVLRGLWYFYLFRMELQTARDLGEHLLTLAQQVGDPALRLEGHRALANTLNYLGEFDASQAHFAQAIALYDPQQHHAHAFRYGEDPGVVCCAYAAVTLWMLGYPDQALQRSHEAVTLARELAYPINLSYALFFAVWVHHFRQEWQLTHERAEAGIALAAEQGFTIQAAGGMIFRGWTLVQQSSAPGAGPGTGRRAWPRCNRAWLPGVPREQRCFSRMVWPCWPRPLPRWGSTRQGSPY